MEKDRLPAAGLIGLLFLSAAASADSDPDPIPAPDAAAVYSKELSLELPFVTGRNPGVPYGFTPSQLDPPITLGFRTVSHEAFSGARPWFEANASFLRFALMPMLSADLGLNFHSGAAEISLGAGLLLQNLLNKAPAAESQYAAVFGELVARASVPMGPLVGDLEARAIRGLKTRMAQLENLDTKIDHQTTYVLSPSVTLPLGPLRVGAGVDLYALGATAIASKEFGFAIEGATVTRWNLSGAYRLSPKYEVYARVAKISGVTDKEEIYFSAPLLGRDYLLADSFATIGVTWHL